MARSVLVIGAEGLLGGYLVADHLLSPRQPGDVIHCEAKAVEAVRHALRLLAPGKGEDLREALLASRLRPVPPGGMEGGIDELWCLPPAGLEDLPRTGAAELSYVSGLLAAAGELERQLEEACAPRAAGWRVFRAGPVLGVPPAGGPFPREGLLELLEALHGLKEEVEERDPEYFDHHALRTCAPAGAALNVISVQHAVRLMRRLAERPDTLRRTFEIASPAGIQYADLCERLGMVYGLSLLSVDREDELNPVDRLFQVRLRGFERHLRATPSGAPEAACREAGVEPGGVWLDEASQQALIQAVRDAQVAARGETRRRAAAVWDALERKEVQSGGSALAYLAGGSGEPPVVILNALGQGLRYWTRLVERLVSGGRRVLLWEPRGTTSAPRPFLLADQVEDLEAVLRAEGVSRCHLVGWCTGPRVAVEFSLRNPDAVASAVFLNASFKCDGSPAELSTDYEEDLETLCRMLDRRPALVASVMSSLRSSAIREEPPEPRDDDSVLTRMNQDLKPEVLAPFRTESSTLNYVRQLIDLWAYDVRARAGQVRTPVLLVGAELDQVASPAASRQAARLFPDARYVEVRGATHYCLYDRPALVADLIERFLTNPRRVDGLAGEVETAA